jgi:hypothetical protein
MEIPFVGPSYNLDSRPSGVQRTVNLIPHPQEPGNERTAWVFQDVPGLVLVTDFPQTEEQVFSIHFENNSTNPFNFSFVSTWDNANPLTAATYASWNAGTGKIDITQAGVYEVIFSAQFDSGLFSSYDSCIGTTPYATGYSVKYPYASGISAHRVASSSQGPGHEQIADVWVLNVQSADSFSPTVYGTCSDSSVPGYTTALVITVRRLGDAVA